MAAEPPLTPGLLGALDLHEPSDSCCWSCLGGGDVLCCDQCRAVFHLQCLGLTALPGEDADWFCPLCSCSVCGQPCRVELAVSISTQQLRVTPRPLQPRCVPQDRVPAGAGYLCPEQVRLWLTQQLPEASAAASPAASAHPVAAGDAQPPAGCGGSEAAGDRQSQFVRCCCCAAACHLGCLPPALRQQYAAAAAAGQEGGQPVLPPYLCSAGCEAAATALASRCALGVVPVDALPDGTPIAWQLIQPAAVAAALEQPAANGGPGHLPRAFLLGTAVAPAYEPGQAAVLAQVTRDALQLLSQQLGPAWECRTRQNALPWLVAGLRQRAPGGLLDLSHMHLAVMWVGSTLVAAALLRLHGAALEVPLVASSPQLPGRQLGRFLVTELERFAFGACRATQAWMPALGASVRPAVGVSLLASWEQATSEHTELQLLPGNAVTLLGLDQPHLTASGAPPASGASGSPGCPSGDAKAAWPHLLGYVAPASSAEWQVPPRTHLLRFAYVPLLLKQLQRATLLPLPTYGPKHGQPASRG